MQAAAASSNSSSGQRALTAAAAAAQAGVQWAPGAKVGPALQALVCNMWGPKQQQQQQQQRLRGHMTSLRQALADADLISGCKWVDGCQQDCSEFVLALLQQLHFEANRVPAGQAQNRKLQRSGSEAQQAAEAAAYAKSWDDSVVLDTFGSQQHSTVTCRFCYSSYHSFSTAQELQAAIPEGLDQPTVQDCLRHTLFAAEQMSGANAYCCERCKEKRMAIKQLQMQTYPAVLPVFLKRFKTQGSCKGGNKADPEAFATQGSSSTGSSSTAKPFKAFKDCSKVQLDAGQVLDLTPFCSPSALQAAAAADKPPPRYELIAVADHRGGMGAGPLHGTCALPGRWSLGGVE
jgi:ubiquitin C-terminal hydrolase